MWTRNPDAPLADSIKHLRCAKCTCLGATTQWIDADDPLSRVPVHGSADGEAAVAEAERFVGRLAELRAAGLGSKDHFLLLRSYSQGCVTHLLRANFEDGVWTKRLDKVFLDGLVTLVGDPWTPNARSNASCALRTAVSA